MKKIILTAILFTLVSASSPTPAYAITTNQVQSMINTSIAPLKTAITNLQGALAALQTVVTTLQTNLTNVQSTVSSLSTRLTTVENIPTSIASISARLAANETAIATDEAILVDVDMRVANLENNAISDFNLPDSWVTTVSASLKTMTIKSTTGVINLSCNWNGLILSQQVQLRGIAHFPNNDYFSSNTCNLITFTGITAFPPSGSTVPVDLSAFWQGKTKQVTVGVLMP